MAQIDTKKKKKKKKRKRKEKIGGYSTLGLGGVYTANYGKKEKKIEKVKLCEHHEHPPYPLPMASSVISFPHTSKNGNGEVTSFADAS